MVDNLKEIMLTNEKLFSEYACKSQDGIKINKEVEDIRPVFFRDIDKIRRSMSQTSVALLSGLWFLSWLGQTSGIYSVGS